MKNPNMKYFLFVLVLVLVLIGVGCTENKNNSVNPNFSEIQTAGSIITTSPYQPTNSMSELHGVWEINSPDYKTVIVIHNNSQHNATYTIYTQANDRSMVFNGTFIPVSKNSFQINFPSYNGDQDLQELGQVIWQFNETTNQIIDNSGDIGIFLTNADMYYTPIPTTTQYSSITASIPVWTPDPRCTEGNDGFYYNGKCSYRVAGCPEGYTQDSDGVCEPS